MSIQELIWKYCPVNVQAKNSTLNIFSLWMFIEMCSQNLKLLFYQDQGNFLCPSGLSAVWHMMHCPVVVRYLHYELWRESERKHAIMLQFPCYCLQVRLKENTQKENTQLCYYFNVNNYRIDWKEEIHGTEGTTEEWLEVTFWNSY